MTNDYENQLGKHSVSDIFNLSKGLPPSDAFSLKQWLLVGLLLRLLVIPFTLHGDMIFVYFYPHFFSHGEWDAYGIGLQKIGVPYYPPLAMIFFALIQIVLRFLFPGFESFMHSVAYEDIPFLDAEPLFLSAFLMKTPYLFFEFFLVKTCLQMLSEDKYKLGFMIFWAINPVVIYSAYMIGHLDLIAAFFVVLAWRLSLEKGKARLACLSLAVGALFKLFPIAFLPMILCVSSRSIKDFVVSALYGTLPVLFFYALFYRISGTSSIGLFTAMGHDLNTSTDYGMLFLRLCQVSIYGLVCAHIIFVRRDTLDYTVLCQYFMIIYMAMYWGSLVSSTHRYIWLMPFFVYYIQLQPRWRLPFYLLIAVIFLTSFRSREQFMGVFSPLNVEFFMSFPSLKDVTWFMFGPKIFDMVMETVFKLGTAVMALLLLKNLYSPSRKEMA